VKYWGISINDHQPDSALEACRTGAIDTVQVILNIFDQTPERNLLPLCRELNIGVLARCPLDEGALTGAITPDVEFDPAEFRAWYFRDNRKQLVFEKVNSLVADLRAAGVTAPLSDIALRYCLTPAAVTSVIPGMRKIRNVEQNMGVSQQGPLTAPILDLLRQHAWDKNFYS
jgi:aryl-alcohol dehydrogenase-like predicted oxidoreductase